MIKNFTYRKKSKLLIAAIVLMLYVSFTFSVSRTLNAYYECERLSEELVKAENLPERINALKQELKISEDLLGDKDERSESVLLETITQYCNKNQVMLKEFPQAAVFSENDFDVVTYDFVLEGSYHKLLKFVYELEQNYKGGRIVSNSFRIMKDIKTRRESLTSRIIIQTIKL